MMMHEVVELQQQQSGTFQHMEAVRERLQAAEQRQQRMVSFFAKLFQNQSFLERLKEKKEQGDVASRRTKRKFVGYQENEVGQSKSPKDRQIVKFRPDWSNLMFSSAVLETSPGPVEQLPDYTSQGMVEMGLGGEGMPFQTENVVSKEIILSDASAGVQRFVNTPEHGTGVSGSQNKDPLKGKSVMSPQQEIGQEYFVSFPEDFVGEKNILELSNPGVENIVDQKDEWTMGFDIHTGMPSSSSELWGNSLNYDIPDFGSTGDFTDLWNLWVDRQPADENRIDKPESPTGPPRDD
uniref:Heat stress transcription factor A-3 n=1 Tax=Rhizophora mucronata TaxID=61149 RepID=A0A2P2K7Y9_RHIMU